MYLCTSERVFRHCAGQSMMIRASANVIERSNYAVATASIAFGHSGDPRERSQEDVHSIPAAGIFLGQ